MEIERNEEKKTISVWLTRAESRTNIRTVLAVKQKKTQIQL